MELAHGGPVVHGVERSHLIHAHGGHLQDPGNLVHDANAGEAVLSLAEIEERHDGGLLVLGRVPLEDLGDDLLILLAELEGNVRVVVGGVAVHHEHVALFPRRDGECAGGLGSYEGPRCSARRPGDRPHEERGELARHGVRYASSNCGELGGGGGGLLTATDLTSSS